ncbi:MAG: Sua5/YciO/YrdC/YwlC family protein [Moraxella sp.]|nr:Sua5/YciO/YrdC/YwlC family protein [Moraxella sp.]
MKPADITHALKQGKLIAYPTETVWGMGCDAFCERAVFELLNIKNRPVDKGLIVLTDKVERILPFLEQLPTERQREIIKSWQIDNTAQATTWLFPIPDNIAIPAWLTGTHDSLAIRVINHPLIAGICCELASDDNPFGFLVSTSCNPNARPPAKDLDTAWTYFGNNPNVMFLDGDTLGYDKPSQIRCALSGKIMRD